MTPKSKQSPQEAIPGMPDLIAQPAVVEENAQRAGFDINRRRAFGSVPRLLGVELETDIVLTRDDMLRVSPSNLEAGLYGEGDYSVNGLVLNAHEYATIMINADTFKSRTAARALKPHKASNPIRRAEVELRAPMHALEALRESHARLIAGALKEKAKLTELREIARTPGFARVTEAEMRIRATDVLQTSFGNLLSVAGQQLNWTVEEQKTSAQALEVRLSTGPQRQRVGQWWQYLDVATNYATRKGALFSQRSHVIDTELKKIDKQLQAFYEQNGISPV